MNRQTDRNTDRHTEKEHLKLTHPSSAMSQNRLRRAERHFCHFWPQGTTYVWCARVLLGTSRAVSKCRIMLLLQGKESLHGLQRQSDFANKYC